MSAAEARVREAEALSQARLEALTDAATSMAAQHEAVRALREEVARLHALPGNSAGHEKCDVSL
ncbi:hypothetical protein EON66_10240 [archaeon]|nr:MAG: hypothetical protein EON66_10240 [archaeon]